MSVNREELKRMIDYIPEQDAVEVLDFIMKRNREAIEHLDIEALSIDEDLIRQVQKSRENRENGQIYNQQTGLDYLQMKIEEFEHGQSL